MTLTTITLSDLAAGDCRERLAGLMAPQATVVVACGDAARLPVAMLQAALAATVASGGFLRFEGLAASARLALLVADPEHRLAVNEAARSNHVGDRPYQVRLAADGSM